MRFVACLENSLLLFARELLFTKFQNVTRETIIFLTFCIYIIYKRILNEFYLTR